MFSSHAHVVHALAHVDEHPLEILLPLRRPGRHHLLDLGVPLRVQRGEGEVLQLPAHLLDAEAVGQWRVDVEGLLRRATLLPLGHDSERAHVVQPVGQLDQQNAPVVSHGDEHLANGRRLLCLLGVELEAVQLGHPVDNAGHPLAEVLLNGLEREPGVLDGVVQQGGGHGLRIEPQLGHDRRHGDRVRDVGLARAPELALVRPGGGPTRRHDHGRVVLGAVAGELGQEGGQQVAQDRHACLLLLEVSSVRLGVCVGWSHPRQGHHPYRLPARGNTERAFRCRRYAESHQLSACACSCLCSCAAGDSAPVGRRPARPARPMTTNRPTPPKTKENRPTSIRAAGR